MRSGDADRNKRSDEHRRAQSDEKQGRDRLEASRRSFSAATVQAQPLQAQSDLQRAVIQTLNAQNQGAPQTKAQQTRADLLASADPRTPLTQIVDYLDEHRVQDQNKLASKSGLQSDKVKTVTPQADPQLEPGDQTRALIDGELLHDLVSSSKSTEKAPVKQPTHTQVNAYEAAAIQNGQNARGDAQAFSALINETGIRVKKVTGDGAGSFGGDTGSLGGEGLDPFAALAKGDKATSRTRFQVAQAARALLSKAAETLAHMRSTTGRRLSLSLPTQDGNPVRLVLTPKGAETHKLVFIAGSVAGAEALKKLLPEIRDEVVSFPIQVDDIEITTDIIENPVHSENLGGVSTAREAPSTQEPAQQMETTEVTT